MFNKLIIEIIQIDLNKMNKINYENFIQSFEKFSADEKMFCIIKILVQRPQKNQKNDMNRKFLLENEKLLRKYAKMKCEDMKEYDKILNKKIMDKLNDYLKQSESN